MSTVKESAPAGVGPIPLRRNRDFMLLWTGAGFASLGSHLTMVLYPLLVVWQGGSPVAAGLVTSAAVLPHLVVQLPAGVLVDRFDRRRLMITADVGCIVVSGSVLAAVALDTVQIGHLMVAAFLHSSFSIGYELAERTAARHLVHDSQVPAALGQNEARKRAVGMLGDPVGSLLFSLVRWTPFLMTVVAHVVSLVELLLIRKRFQAERTVGTARDVRTEIAEGIRWLWRQPFLRAAMLLIAGSNLIFAGIILTLIVIIHNSGTSPAAVGLILAAGGLGGVVGALTASWWRRLVPIRAILPGGLFVWALAIAPLAVLEQPVSIGVLFACCGYIGGAINVIGYVYAVQVTPDEILGRAMSVMMLLGSGANFLGALAIGFALDAWRVDQTVVVMAAGMSLLALIGLVNPAVKGVREPSEAHSK
ncbi:MAG TPA: MFS transporter [Asanoa sp.]|nr:MFS transporter [Asanoa sp.]